MTDLFFVIPAVIGTFIIALFTYLKNPESSTNKLFFLFAFSLAFYGIINYFSLHQQTLFLTLFFIRTTMFIAAFINLFYFLLVFSFPQPKLQMNSRLLAATIILTFCLGTLAYTSFIFKDVVIRNGNIEPASGLGLPLFLVHTLILLGGGFIELIRKLKRATGIAKTQIRIFLLGTVIMFLSILLTNVFMVLVVNTSAFVGLLPFYILVFVGFISYAMIRHRFLDISFLVGRTVSYAILLTIFALIFTFFMFLGSKLFLSITFSLDEQILLFGIMIGMLISYQTVRRGIDRMTDKYLFRDRYHTNAVLGKLSHIMASTLRLEDLTHGLLEVILRELKITKAAFILLNSGLIADVKSEGFDSPPVFADEDVKQIAQTRSTVIFDELEEESLKSILRQLQLSLVIHLRTKGAQIGLLVFGAKSSGDIYSERDVSLLEILASEAAIAVQNSQSYEEIRRFNITLQEEVERATVDLKIANKKLIQLDKMKDEFVSLASHELRTPMTAIKSYTWMVLNNKAGELTPKGREYLDVVFQSTERLIRLVNEMLDISRIESGRIQMKIEPFDLVKLLAEIKEEFMARVTERQLTLATVCAESAIPMTGDRGKILQIIENLVGNSVKFTPPSGKITVTATKTDHQATVAVADTGRGIKPEDLAKLFQKFGHLEQGSLTTIAESGTGLGLYLSKQYAQFHGGSITVASEVGKGTTFTVTLPMEYHGGLPETPKDFTIGSSKSTLATSSKG